MRLRQDQVTLIGRSIVNREHIYRSPLLTMVEAKYKEFS